MYPVLQIGQRLMAAAVQKANILFQPCGAPSPATGVKANRPSPAMLAAGRCYGSLWIRARWRCAVNSRCCSVPMPATSAGRIDPRRRRRAHGQYRHLRVVMKWLFCRRCWANGTPWPCCWALSMRSPRSSVRVRVDGPHHIQRLCCTTARANIPLGLGRWRTGTGGAGPQAGGGLCHLSEVRSALQTPAHGLDARLPPLDAAGLAGEWAIPLQTGWPQRSAVTCWGRWAAVRATITGALRR